jgi:hypothetical protein
MKKFLRDARICLKTKVPVPIGECYTVILSFISPLYFHRQANGKCSSASEEHIINPKTCIVPYLDLESFIFARN